MELAPSVPVYQGNALEKRKVWLSAPDTTLWDRGKTHNPKTTSPRRTERNRVGTSIENF